MRFPSVSRSFTTRSLKDRGSRVRAGGVRALRYSGRMDARAYRAVAFAIVAMLTCVAVHAASDVRAAAAPGEAANEAPVACRTSAECPHLACGPCTAGTPITSSMVNGPECAVNP